MLTIGSKAPDFTLPDQNGNLVSLVDFRGKRVVLYFYSKDNTPGCTRQACAFAAAHREFDVLDVQVIGISKDGVDSHLKFANKHSLPFILLSDPDKALMEQYGVLQEKVTAGKVEVKVARTTFIINQDGFIEKIMHKVKPDTNAAEIIEYLKTQNGGKE